MIGVPFRDISSFVLYLELGSSSRFAAKLFIFIDNNNKNAIAFFKILFSKFYLLLY